MDVFIHPSAEKALKKISPELQRKIKECIKKLSENPYSQHLDVLKLKGVSVKTGLFRLRVGEYRIIYAIQEDKLWITDVIKREKGYHF